MRSKTPSIILEVTSVNVIRNYTKLRACVFLVSLAVRNNIR